jgi:hypothetical protein
MHRTLSSAWTFFYKYLLPVVWIAGFAIAARAAVENPAALSAGSPGGALPYSATLLIFIGLAGLASLVWFCTPLKRVRMGDDGSSLLISNYLSEWEVPTSLITDVTQNRWIKLRPITIHLRIDPGCGTRVVFMPPIRLNFLFWREDPEVAELRELAAGHVRV